MTSHHYLNVKDLFLISSLNSNHKFISLTFLSLGSDSGIAEFAGL